MTMRCISALLASLFLSSLSSIAQKPVPGVPVGHAGQITSIDFSPDGRFAVSSGESGNVKLWELSTGRLLKNWHPSSDQVESLPTSEVAFINQGKEILIGSTGNPLLAWDFHQPGEVVRSFIDPGSDTQASIWDFSISPNGTEVLALSAKNELKRWNLKSGKFVNKFPKPSEKMVTVCYALDGKTAYTGTRKGNILKWSMKNDSQEGTINMHSKSVNALSISPDGNTMLSGSTDYSVKLWDMATNKVLQAFDYAYSPGQSAVFSPNGKHLAFGNNDQNIIIWDIENKVAIDTFRSGHTRNITEVRYSPDAEGKYIISGALDKSLILWDAASGAIIHRLQGYTKMVKQIDFSSDKTHSCIVQEFSKDITTWNAKKEDGIVMLTGHTADVIAARFSPDGSYLLSSSDDRTMIRWDFGDSLQKVVSKKLDQSVQDLAVSPNERYAITTSNDKTVDLWDLDKMEVIKTFTGHTDKVTSLAFSLDGQFAMSGSNDNTVKIYEVKSGRQVASIPGQADRISPVAFSPDGQFFLSISCAYSKVDIWSIKKKATVHSFSTEYDPDKPDEKIYCGSKTKAAISPKGERFLLTNGLNALLWKMDSDQPIFLRGHKGLVKSVAFSANGEVAITGSYDGSIKLWSVLDGRPLATIYHLNGADWVAMTPSGLFDASAAAMEKMYFVQGLESIDLDQLKELYHEPGLLALLMGYKKGRPREVEALEELDLYPEISANIKNNKLYIDLKKRSGGIGKTSVFINGTEVLSDACAGKANCPAIDLDVYKKHFFSADTSRAKNVITIRAYSENDWLKSPPYEIYPFSKRSRGGSETNTDPFDDFNLSFAEPPPPSLHAIIVGTSDYAGENIDLDFPHEDGKAMAETIKKVGGKLFGDTSVKITLLTTEAEENSKQPSKANVRKAFQNAAKAANAEDVLIIFLAGHGTTYSDGGNSDFYYLTKDCGDLNLKIQNVRNNLCISTDTLTEWISAIPAKKRVVILDACHSGAAASNIGASRSLGSTQKRELERLKDRNGMFVLASSESGQKSYEDDQLRQGLLTYSLLYGMKSMGGVEKDGAVDILKLFQFARNYVPVLAADEKGGQTPVLTIPSKEASSFSIGIVDDPSAIPLGQQNQFISQSVFLDQEAMNDHLSLSTLLDEHLAEDIVEGKLGEMIFNNSRDGGSSAYSIRGLYKINNGMVNLDGRVFQGNNEKASFKVENAPMHKSRELVRRIVKAINEKL